MPVEDHAVHPSTKHGSEFRYTTCQNKQRQAGYWVLSRSYSAAGYYDLTEEFVKDTSSPGCRYMDYEGDQGCTGCPQPKDMEYIEKMRVLK